MKAKQASAEPADSARALGAAVGEHLHDRYEIGVITEMKRPFKLLEGVKFDTDPGDPAYAEWLASGRGVYATSGVVIGFQMKSERGLPDRHRDRGARVSNLHFARQACGILHRDTTRAA